MNKYNDQWIQKEQDPQIPIPCFKCFFRKAQLHIKTQLGQPEYWLNEFKNDDYFSHHNFGYSVGAGHAVPLLQINYYIVVKPSQNGSLKNR